MPQFILRGFADHDGFLVKHDLRSGSTHDSQRAKGIARAKNFYTVLDGEGNESSAVEDWLGQLESRAGPLLQQLCRGAAVTETEWAVVASLVALQRLRGPAARQLWVEFDAELDLLRPYVEGIPEAGTCRQDSIRKMIALAKLDAEIVARDYVPVVFSWPNHSLLTGDTPVLTIEDRVPVGLNLTTARGLFLPITHSTGIFLWNTECYPQPVVRGFEPARSVAKRFNRAIVRQSLRQIVWHPRSDVDQLIGEDFKFPPERTVVHQTSENTERMARALRWADENPQEEHPFARIPAIEMPPNARPLSASLRRQLFDAGFFD